MLIMGAPGARLFNTCWFIFVVVMLTSCSAGVKNDAAAEPVVILRSTPSNTFEVEVESSTALTSRATATGFDDVQRPGIKITKKPELLITPSGVTNKPTSSPTSAAMAAPLVDVVDLHQEPPIRIVSPGDGSRVVSPIGVVIYLDETISVPLLVELRGSDGRLIVRHVRSVDNVSSTDPLPIDLMFEIASPREAGRLLIGQKDKYGRFMNVNSVDLTLLSEGETKITLSEPRPQAILIQQPAPDGEVTGGMVSVSGVTSLGSDELLRVELITEDGKIVGQRLAGVTPGPSGAYATFTAEVPYSVVQDTPVRVIVYQDGNPISDIKHLSSIEIVLTP